MSSDVRDGGGDGGDDEAARRRAERAERVRKAARRDPEPSGVQTVVAPRTGVGDEPPRERTPDPTDVLVGGRYRVARRIGKGGMGEVMAARDEQIGRDVAIKRLRAAAPSERSLQRFLREASIQGRLEHPAIVPVHEIGRDTDGLPFFVMKKLAGTTLAQLLEARAAAPKAAPRQRESQPVLGRGEFSLQQILRAFVEVCLAIEFAHVRGVVHRDLKPDNIMLGDFGEVYVLDWGVAKVIGEPDGEGDFADVDSHGGSGEHATVAGTTIGTPGYMAPEQVRGMADIDGRTDVYTLGALLYEILAGEPLHPRGYEGLQSALLANDNRPSRRGVEVPPELDALCAQATTPDREVRVQTARELGERVQRYLDGDRDLAMRKSLARRHLERAREAFARTTEDSTPTVEGVADADDPTPARTLAMREAAAALALDPSPGAAELVGRLMLEPPETTPREVAEAIRADDIRAAKVNAQAGMLSVLLGLVFTPLVWWMAPSGSRHVLAMTIVLLVMGGVSLYNYVTPKPLTGLVVIGNAVLVGTIACGYSPILIAPGLGAVLAMALVFTPRFSFLGSGVMIGSTTSVAILGPWLLERLGVLAPTMFVQPDGVRFDAPAISGNELPILVVGSLYVVGLIGGAAVIGEVMRTRTREAHRTLMMQAWQLRQLVPKSG